MSRPTTRIRRAYRELLDHHGPQYWWPADTVFEMMIGAVLVQNTAWTGAERALENLRGRGLLEPRALAGLSPSRLAPVIRPAGTHGVKARRLLAMTRWYVGHGCHDGLGAWDSAALRASLLGVHGIGPESADAILCYAFDRPVFPVDAYARRLYRRLGVMRGGEGYEALRAMTERALGRDAARLGEWHALVVAHGKAVCRPRPLCNECTLARSCPRAGLG